MYVYIKSEIELWTVGFYDPQGKWMAESDHDTADEAATRVSILNATSIMPVMKTQASEFAFPRNSQVPGLTKREYFACLAMQGIISGLYAAGHSFDEKLVANEAERMAGHLVISLNSNP